jgi:hypothetical protein
MRELTLAEQIAFLHTLWLDAEFRRARLDDVARAGVMSHPGAALIFDGLMAYCREHGELPPPLLLADDVRHRASASGDAVLAAATKTAWRAMFGKQVTAASYCSSVLDERLREMAMERLRDAAEDADPNDEASRRAIREMALGLDAPGRPRVGDLRVDTFRPGTGRRCKQGAKKLYHVDWLDGMTMGGGADGDTLLMVIPSGGGKTTIGLQMAHGAAMVGKHTTIVYTEQSPATDPDIQLRQCVLASKAPRTVWMQINETIQDVPDDEADERWNLLVEARLTPGQLTHLRDGLDKWRSHVDLLDCVSHPIEDLDAFLVGLDEDWTARGIEPYTLVFDWLGPLFSSLAASRNLRSDREFRDLQQTTIKRIKGFCADRRVRGVFFHQTAGASVKPNTTGAPSASSFRGQESSTLPLLNTYSMAATTQFAEGLFWMVADKMRSAKQCRRRLRMDGLMCRVDEAREEKARIAT